MKRLTGADVHSHGKYEPGYDNNNFSSVDKTDNNNKNIKGYLTTPNGTLKKYDPRTGIENVVRTDLPSDPNDPNRKNNIPPTETSSVPTPNPTQTRTPSPSPENKTQCNAASWF